MGIFLTTNSCNIFEWMDSPSNQEQILSAARTCFDEADLTCAKEYYAQLTDYTDEKESELIFAILHEQGATMASFLQSFGGGGGGNGLNKLAAKLIPTSQAKREALFDAYLKAANIKNKELRGLAHFATAIAVAGAVLAADMDEGQTEFKKSRLVENVTECEATSQEEVCTQGHSSCAAPPGANISASTSVSFETATLSEITASLGVIDGAILAVGAALTNELGAGGKFSTGTGDFASTVAAQASNDDDCYRKVLMSQGVGTDD